MLGAGWFATKNLPNKSGLQQLPKAVQRQKTAENGRLQNIVCSGVGWRIELCWWCVLRQEIAVHCEEAASSGRFHSPNPLACDTVESWLRTFVIHFESHAKSTVVAADPDLQKFFLRFCVFVTKLLQATPSFDVLKFFVPLWDRLVVADKTFKIPPLAAVMNKMVSQPTEVSPDLMELNFEEKRIFLTSQLWKDFLERRQEIVLDLMKKESHDEASIVKKVKGLLCQATTPSMKTSLSHAATVLDPSTPVPARAAYALKFGSAAFDTVKQFNVESASLKKVMALEPFASKTTRGCVDEIDADAVSMVIEEVAGDLGSFQPVVKQEFFQFAKEWGSLQKTTLAALAKHVGENGDALVKRLLLEIAHAKIKTTRPEVVQSALLERVRSLVEFLKIENPEDPKFVAASQATTCFKAIIKKFSAGLCRRAANDGAGTSLLAAVMQCVDTCKPQKLLQRRLLRKRRRTRKRRNTRRRRIRRAGLGFV